MEPKISFHELLKPFHIKVKNELYYIEALTHSSYAHEMHSDVYKDYEKLEPGSKLCNVKSFGCKQQK